MVAVQVRSLSGRTAFIEGVASGDVAGLRARVSDLEGIPADCLRLTSAGRELHESAGHDTFGDVPVTVLLRLLGGKGGFGAMLRTAGARGVKTTNFDACRDLNGRRLRHVNAEAQLREWDAKAEERKLKQQQQKALNAKPHGPALIERFDDDEYDEMLQGARSRVTDALAASAAVEVSKGESSSSSAAGTSASGASGATPASGQVGTASGKRKVADDPPQGAKAAKLWADPLAMLGADDTSDDSGEEGEEAHA
jgi:hypothetical protein